MKILLDTNIIIHREANTVINEDIGQLFNWIDKLHYDKFIHPITIEELNKHVNKNLVKTIQIKIQNYNILKTISKIDINIQKIIDGLDKSDNDKNDTLILNELYNSKVDVLISEDKNIHKKAKLLHIQDKVYDIERFLENVLSVHPDLLDYKVLSIKKEYFGNIDLSDNFFDSFKSQYLGFEKWFLKKSNDLSYICKYDNKVRSFLYLKIENKNENYYNFTPVFQPKKRLKIGTFKLDLYAVKLGERFLKIIFDNALIQKVDEIYFTIFNNSTERKALINLMESFGFKYYGIKRTESGIENVYVRSFTKDFNFTDPKLTFPYISLNSDVHFISIIPEYHTELFPDSILRTESPNDYVENEPHRNAICKVYISHAFERNLKSSDIIVFYRTGGKYKGVVTTIGIVESIKDNLRSEKDLLKYARGKTALSENRVKEFWHKYPNLKPFIINFLYAYSLPKRPNLKSLIDVGVFKDLFSIPRGISELTKENFKKILDLSKTNENIIVD